MFLIVVIACAIVLSVLEWFLIQSAPRMLSMLLPQKLTFIVGTSLFIVAMFSAFLAAYLLHDPKDMLGCFVQGYVGLWFMLSTSSSARGSYLDDRMLRRLFVMMGLIIAEMIAALYVHGSQAMAMLNLLLVTGGFWVTTNYLQFLDRDRGR